MTSTDRRSFLGASLAASAAASLPDWLANVFGPQDPFPAGPARGPLLRERAKLAQEHGKPLLVLLIPRLEETQFEHGRWLGTWLAFGGADTLATIAACVPVAASPADVRAVFGAVAIEGAPMLLLVDVAKFGDAAAPVPRVTPVAVPSAPKAPDRSDFTAALTKALGEALHAHAGDLDAMAQRVRDRLPADQLAALQAWGGGGAVPADAVLLRAAPLVRCLTATWPVDVRQQRLEQATAAFGRELQKKPLPGSMWGSSFGCGCEIEDADGKTKESMIACGRGNVPPTSRRFLYFYTRTL